MKWLRWNAFRLIALTVFGALALGVVPESWRDGNAILPRLSPLLNLGGALAARQWIGWSLLLAVPLLVLPLFKGRFFCWRICPMGFLAELTGKLNPWGKGIIKRVPTINKVLTLVSLVTAALGDPLLIWLDPLCIFNGFFAAWRTPLTGIAAVTGIGFVAILLLSLIAPNIWCHRLCPLGGLEEALMLFAKRFKTAPAAKSDDAAPKALTAAPVARRTVLAAITAGIAGAATRRVTADRRATVIRPPSADIDRFNALCARCGNCMKVCPYQLIQPDLGASGIDGLFTPVLRFRSQNEDQESYCFQDCTKCTQVCPTGALHPFTVEQKHASPIGLAVVDRAKCLAWAKNEFCVVCDEYCPYKAIIIEKHGDVMCPIVDPNKCRGCAACESACPGDPIAISVKPL
ncbi:MAG: 4Fe-4S binding protein [Kiritimatiellae bacterium]|nr:4Fe-4S binding protein [Kiritimatiellia bacterium]